MGVNSLPKTVTRQRPGCDLNPGPSTPESSTLTTRLRATVITDKRIKRGETERWADITDHTAVLDHIPCVSSERHSHVVF